MLNRHDHNFQCLLHKHRANLFGGVGFPVPNRVERKLLSTFQPPQFRRLPWRFPDGLFHLGGSEAALGQIALGMPGQSNRFHGFDVVRLPHDSLLASDQFSAECKPPVPARKAIPLKRDSGFCGEAEAQFHRHAP